MDAEIRRIIRRGADGLEPSHMELPSGAVHDAQSMSHIAPAALIFLPSKGGRCHCAAEYTDFADVENGANVLLATLLELAST